MKQNMRYAAQTVFFSVVYAAAKVAMLLAAALVAVLLSDAAALGDGDAQLCCMLLFFSLAELALILFCKSSYRIRNVIYTVVSSVYSACVCCLVFGLLLSSPVSFENVSAQLLKAVALCSTLMPSLYLLVRRVVQMIRPSPSLTA